MKRPVALLAILLALAGCVNPSAIGVQDFGSITGRVIDAKTNQPINNAIVNVGSTNATHTDAGGAFTLTMVPAGTQPVNVIANGYSSGPPTDVMVTKDQTTVLQTPIALNPV